MYSEITIQKDHLKYSFTASTVSLDPVDGQQRVSLTVSSKLTVADYSTHYCSLQLVVESPSMFAYGLPFSMMYDARQAILNDSYSALKEPSKTNQILTEIVGQLGEYNGRVTDTTLKRWADYAMPTKLSEEAEQRIEALMDLELTDDPIVPVEITGKTEADPMAQLQEVKNALRELMDRHGVCVDDSPDWYKEPLEGQTETSKPSDFTGDPSDDDMIPDSGYDGLYA